MIRPALAAVLALAPPAAAQLDPPAWTRATPPFRIVGPIWYVGSEGLAAYLIRTSAGAILLDGTMAENARLVARNIRSVGVDPRQVKLLLVSHAHFDHAGADAALKRLTGARLVAGAGDRAALESGHPPGENLSGGVDFAPVTVDRTVRDGDTVRLGDTVLTARLTPGHTPGCTTWTLRVRDAGRPLNVVFPCSLTVAGNRLYGNRAYPGIVEDYRLSFQRLDRLPADVVLPAHPEGADVLGRHRRGESYVAPGLLQRIVAQARQAFEAELLKQRAIAR